MMLDPFNTHVAINGVVNSIEGIRNYTTVDGIKGINIGVSITDETHLHRTITIPIELGVPTPRIGDRALIRISFSEAVEDAQQEDE